MAAVRRSLASVSHALTVEGLGHWEMDIVEGERGALRWSDEVYEIFGLPPEEGAVTLESFRAQLHSKDRGRVREAMDTALAEAGGRFSMRYRIRRPDGSRGTFSRREECSVTPRGLRPESSAPSKT